MKTKLFALALAVLAMVSITGCTTAQIKQTVTPENVAKASILIKNTTSSTLVLVIDKNGDNAKAYVSAVKTALDQFLLASSADPGALEAALYKLPIKELKKPEATLIVNAVLTAYEIYYADYVKGQVNGNDTARQLLTALRDGADNALAISSGTK